MPGLSQTLNSSRYVVLSKVIFVVYYKYKRLEIIIRYAFFQTVNRIAKMNSVAFDSGAFHPEMMAIACIRDVNRQ